MDGKENPRRATHFITGSVVLHLVLLAAGAVWPAVDHGIFEELLSKYNRDGWIDYAGFKREERRLDAYLEALAATDPDTLTRDGQFAYFINAYNAWTIKLILGAYPGIESIKDLGGLFRSPWKKKFVRLKEGLVTLDHIEHDILRPRFKDPRVHVALNCASKGCPPLLEEPFAGEHLEEQLDSAARRFVNDPRYNRLEGNTLHASSIFKWFAEDFDHDIVGFFEKYAAGELKRGLDKAGEQVRVAYLDYDWSLNGQ
jgi:hypothetical protein